MVLATLDVVSLSVPAGLLKIARSGRTILVSGFFFSSRRRHTRFDCDWSSDVCSSDLADGTRLVLEGSANLRRNGNTEQFCLVNDSPLHDFHAAYVDAMVVKHESDQSGSDKTG